MLSMNMSAAPQINPSAENPVAITTNSKSKPIVGEKQKTGTEKFAQVLEREITEASPKQEITGSSEKPEKSHESVGQITDSNAPQTHSAPVPTMNPLQRDIALDAAHAPKGDLTFLPLAVMPVPGMALPATEAVRPGAEIGMLNPLLAPPNLSSLPANPLPSMNGLLPPADSKPAATALSFTSQMLLQRSAQMTPVTNDMAYSPDNLGQFDFGRFMDLAESAADGKLLPFSSELGETILINSTASEEPILSITAESVPTLSLGGTHATSSAPQHVPAQSIQVDQPVGQPRWGGDFAQKIVWLTSQQHQVAEIHLNPAHLGPVEVMLSISQDQATAQFVSPNLAVREAIEQALPKLREMMAENGIQLGNVMVGAESFQQDNKQQHFFSGQAPNDPKSSSATLDPVSQMETTVVSNKHNGIVNTYA